MLKVISIDELQPGMMITQVIKQNGPVKIRKVGMVRSPDMVTGLIEMGVLSVEIDEQQSVELEPVEKTASMTQKLLQGDYDHANQIDKSLSDQFNRNLFLPSVSELPSMWQIYLKQAGQLASVIVFGVMIGFTFAYIVNWVEAPELEDTPVAVDEKPLNTPVTEGLETSTQMVEESQKTEITVAAQTAQMNESPSGAEGEILLGESPSDEPLSDIEQALQEGGELITQTEQPDSLSGVSAELLERFNKALNDIENEPDSGQSETKVTVVNDIPRVDQLSAQILSRLPSMVFSAHMYSSNPSTRWVRVNGQQLFEGEWVDTNVQLINIEPQRVVLSYQGELFTMAALTDW